MMRFAFGLAPALQSVRQTIGAVRARQVLVSVQVAASCVLLILASVITRFAISRLTIDARFDYNRMVAVNLYRANLKNLKGTQQRQLIDEVAARLEHLHGVDRVTSASVPPLGFLANMMHLPNLPPVYLNDVAPSYFDTMAIPLVRGRTFRTGESNAVIVSESAARAVWGTDNPVGKLWDLGEEDTKGRGTPWREDASQPNARSKKGFTSFATLTPCARISLSKSHESSFSSDRLEAHSKNEGGPGVR
jgi:hypothetical protein